MARLGLNLKDSQRALINTNVPLGTECSICGEDFNTETIANKALTKSQSELDYLYGRVLSCGHRFCFSCIQNWLEYNLLLNRNNKTCSCPNCRTSIISTEYTYAKAAILAYNELINNTTNDIQSFNFDDKINSFYYNILNTEY